MHDWLSVSDEYDSRVGKFHGDRPSSLASCHSQYRVVADPLSLASIASGYRHGLPDGGSQTSVLQQRAERVVY